MSRPDAEREEPPGPSAAARYALRALDACLNPLQRWRDRLAGKNGRDGSDDRRGRATRDAAPAEAGTEPARPSRLRRLSIALLLLLVGLGTGGFLAYRTLSLQLKEHDSIVERMQDELDATRKEDARNVKLLDRFQRENAEYRHEAREAQREAENANRRVAELEARIEDMKRAELAAQQAKRAVATVPRAKTRTPQKTGNCAVGTAGDLSNCIEQFNR
jgi:hypothetical protein